MADLLADPATFRPLLVIELDDPSHNRRDRQDRDDFFNQAINSAGLPCLRVANLANPDLVPTLRQIEQAEKIALLA